MKVLILYNQLFHYRIPIFNLLAENVDLTVAYSLGFGNEENVNFKVLKLPVYKFGRFVFHNENILKLCNKYDVVIAYGDIAWLKLSTLPFRRYRKFKIIFWSIGVSASYDKAFDSIKRWDKMRDFFYKKADALIFYTDYPIKKYLTRGYFKEKMFVAPNTVEVFSNNDMDIKKNSILFIGTLYMQKGLLALLENYKAALSKNSSVPVLDVVGGGEEFNTIQDWIETNNLSKNVTLHGAIYDIEAKASLFAKSFACISPNQAGLSVLESMGYGVPFITKKDSITGGERLNIISNENGVLFEDESQLTDIILDITANPQKYIQMGTNAKNYYRQCRKPIDMANGLFDAIQYVLK